jgi:methionyl-tRNA formyltransferase
MTGRTMEHKKETIGPVDTIILFGGGMSVVDFAREAKKQGLRTCVFAAPRHLSESFREEHNATLQEILEKGGILCYSSGDINRSPDLRKVVTGHTLGLGLGEVYVFSKETIDLFRGRLFDFMVIHLPQYRGGAHFTWQILRNDRIGCWNIQRINEEMVPGVFDSGEILKSREYIIPPSARIPDDYFKAARSEAKNLFIEFLAEVQADASFTPTALQEQFRSYFPRLYTLRHGFINWAWTGGEIERFICAFDNPYPGASTFVAGRRVFLKSCQLHDTDGTFHPFMAGLIYRIEGSAIFVAVNNGSLVVRSITDEHGADLSSSLKPGQRFYTPASLLEDAMQFDAEYDANGLTGR